MAHDATVKIGLDAAAFTVSEVTGGQHQLVTEFRHDDTRCFFLFDWVSGYAGQGFLLRWWPSSDGTDPTAGADTWPKALDHFVPWLELVKDGIETPDVWAIAREQREWLTSTEPVSYMFPRMFCASGSPCSAVCRIFGSSVEKVWKSQELGGLRQEWLLTRRRCGSLLR